MPPDDRFAFGENWRRFLETLDDQRIEAAEGSLSEMLGLESLGGLEVLDIGSGSGLFSLAAMRLGAQRLHSFDYDPDSVGCTQELRARYFPDAENWTVQQGDATDPAFVESLGKFDVVYSWGVLHHTGAMWKAIDNACSAVNEKGTLFISIYNDTGYTSRVWKQIKKLYSTGPRFLRPLIMAVAGGQLVLKSFVLYLSQGDVRGFFRSWSRKGGRGMGARYDLIDWVGGYPFEVAGAGEIFHFCEARGFRLRVLRTTTSHGVNEFVFDRTTAPVRAAPAHYQAAT